MITGEHDGSRKIVSADGANVSCLHSLCGCCISSKLRIEGENTFERIEKCINFEEDRANLASGIQSDQCNRSHHVIVCAGKEPNPHWDGYETSINEEACLNASIDASLSNVKFLWCVNEEDNAFEGDREHLECGI